MTIIGILLFIFVVAFVLRRTTNNYDLETFSVVCSIFAGVLLVLCFLSLGINRLAVASSIQGFEAIRSSRLLTEGSPSIEAAAWRMKAADSNQWLAETKYYNSTAFDIWIPDEIEKVKPIQ